METFQSGKPAYGQFGAHCGLSWAAPIGLTLFLPHGLRIYVAFSRKYPKKYPCGQRGGVVAFQPGRKPCGTYSVFAWAAPIGLARLLFALGPHLHRICPKLPRKRPMRAEVGRSNCLPRYRPRGNYLGFWWATLFGAAQEFSA